MKYSGIGGQAVIEGIMMQNGENYAVAVRKHDGEIEVKKDTYRSVTKKYPFLGIPFIRGVFKFADSNKAFKSKKEEKFPENAVAIDSLVLLAELKKEVAMLLTSAPAIIPVATRTGRKKIVRIAPLPKNF